MRLALTLFILTLGAFPGRAATGLSTPIFTNFYTPHFIVAPNATPTQIIKSRIFGTTTNITTNIFNNTVNIFTNSTIIINGTNLAGGDSLWTNRNSLYYPTVTDAQTIVFGRSAEAWWVPTLADGFVSIHDASAGDSQFNSLAIAAIDNVIQENYGQFTSTLGSGAAPAGAMQLLAATNWQNPSAPFSKFSVALQPAYGEVLLDLMNNGVHEFAVSNQITSVQAIQLVPITNSTLALGANQINVQSNSFISLVPVDPDPSLSTISLSTGLRDGMLLLLKNVGVALGFTLPNGSPLYDDPTKYVTLPGGTWVSTNYGDSMLLAGGLNGWTEIKRWGQNTNAITDQLWANSSGTYYPLQPQTSLVSTNIASYGTLSSYGALKLLSSSLVVLLAGDNNVDPYYSSSLRLYGVDSTPGNTTVHLGVGSGRGQVLFISSETNALQILNGDTLFNDTSKHLYLSGGDWKPTNNNEMLSLFEIPIGWMEIGRNKINTNIVSGDQLWELVSGHMRTVPDTLSDWQFQYGGVPQLTISSNGAVSSGPTTSSMYGASLTNGEAFYAFRNTTNGDPNLARNLTKVQGGASTNFGLIQENILSDQATTTWQGETNGVISSVLIKAALGDVRFTGGNTSSNFWSFIPLENNGASVNGYASPAFYFNSPVALTNPISGWFHANKPSVYLGTDASITLIGYPGLSGADYATNYARSVFKHTGTNGAIVFDSQSAGTAGSPREFDFNMGGTNLAFITRLNNQGRVSVRSPDNARTLTMSADNDTTGGFGDVSLSAITLFGSGFNYTFQSGNVLSTLPSDLGSQSFKWRDTWLNSTSYVSGYDSLLGDYARLALYHSGTNGDVVFDSQSAGTAGNPRPVQFSFNGTNAVTLAHNSGNPYLTITNTASVGLKLQSDTNPTLSSIGGNGLFLDGGTNYVALMHSGAPAWYVGSVGGIGSLLAASDGVQNIGLSGNNRPGSVFVKTNIVLNPITKAQKTALTPAEGMIVMQSDNTAGLRVYQGGAWMMISTVADP